MTRIERQVHLDVAPMRVAAELAGSTWRSAYRIEPVGAGSRVEIVAEVAPEALALTVESAVLAEVCEVRSRLESELGQTTNKSSTTSNTRTTTRTTTKRKTNRATRRTTMTTISRQVTVNAPSAQVWDALADFGGIAAWNPNVKQSKLTSTKDEGEGITRECQLTPMGTVQERVKEWTDGKMMSIEIYEFKNIPAMRSAVAVLSLDPRGATTDVTMQMDYEVGLGSLGAGMNTMVMKRQYAKAITSLLAGLKFHVETGLPVERGSDLEIDAVVAA